MSDDSHKVPSQIFKWFERMKGNYEQSVQHVLKQFESYSQSQQTRIDETHNQQVLQLQNTNEQISKQYEKQIEQLNKDVAYYRQQIDKQQKTIEEMNTRYDSVVRCMLPSERENNIKDIFSEHDFVTPINNSLSSTAAHTPPIENSNIQINTEPNNTNKATNETHNVETIDNVLPSQDELFDQAILKRKNGECEQAFILFEQAAKLGHVKSMGAMGRSFFLGEGTDENPCLGLAWLINAANNELPQAIERVKHFEEHEPELYEEALLQANEL